MNLLELEASLKLNLSDYEDALDDAERAAGNLDLSGAEDAAAGVEYAANNAAGALGSMGDDIDLSGVESDTAEASDAIDGMGDSAGDASSSFGNMTENVSSSGTELVASVTDIFDKVVEAVQMGIDAINDFDEAEANIIRGTGYTGDALGELSDAAYEVYMNFSDADLTLQDTYNIVGELNTRFGFTGESVKTAATEIAKYNEVTGTTGISATDGLANAMYALGLVSDDDNVTIENMKILMEDLVTASQATGESVDTYTGYLSENSAAIEAMGLSSEEALAIFASMDSGVQGNASSISTLLTRAYRSLGDELGEEFGPVMLEAIQQMEDAESASELLNETIGETGITYADAFGSKNVTEVVNGFNKSRESVDEMSASFQSNTGIVDEDSEAIGGLVDTLDMLKKGAKDELVEVGDTFTDTGNVISDFVGTLSDDADATQSTIDRAAEYMLSGETSIGQSMYGIVSSAETAIDDVASHVHGKTVEIGESMSDMKTDAENSMQWNLNVPHISLPHFSISGQFSLSPLSIPSISVSWYSKAMEEAMTMNGATIFGMDGSGNLLGGGEVGSEVISGEDHLIGLIESGLSDVMDAQMSGIYKLLATYLPNIGKMSIDGKELASTMSERMAASTSRQKAVFA